MSIITPQQKNQNVIEAGRGAYRMIIAVSGNPHSKQPYRDLWDKGWRLERRKEEATRLPKKDDGHAPREKRPPFKREGDPGVPKHRHPKQNERRNRTQVGQPVAAPPTPQPLITDKLIARFNKRHQTRT